MSPYKPEPMPRADGDGPKLNALPGTTLAVFRDIALGSMGELDFKPAYDWKPWLLGCAWGSAADTACATKNRLDEAKQRVLVGPKTIKILTIFCNNLMLCLNVKWDL